MSKRTKQFLSVVAVAALVMGVGASARAATTDHKVRQSDFVSGYSDTRTAGAFGFGPKGLVVETKGKTDTEPSSSGGTQNADKVAEYYKPSGTALPPSGSYDWNGSSDQPGSQIVFDVDGTAGNSSPGQTVSNDYNVLVGEQVYSTNAPGENLTDWWYTGGSAKASTHGITCPSTSGGSGSDCHGTLEQWQSAVPDAVVNVVGFSLGSGLQGEGVLKDQTYGGDTYTFTAGDAPVVTPPGGGGGGTTPPAGGGGTTTPPEKTKTDTRVVSIRRAPSKGLAVIIDTSDLKADQSEGAKADVQLMMGYVGAPLYTRVSSTMGPSEEAYFTQTLASSPKTRHVVIKVNGVTKSDFTVRP